MLLNQRGETCFFDSLVECISAVHSVLLGRDVYGCQFHFFFPQYVVLVNNCMISASHPVLMSVASFTVLEVAPLQAHRTWIRTCGLWGSWTVAGPESWLHCIGPDLYQKWDDIAQGRLVGGLELE